jgi:hypothetical protein
MTLSRATLAMTLELELRGLRVFQVFMRRLGPADVVYVSALAWGADDNIVECKASAMSLSAALEQLLSNLDQATAPEDP